MCGEDIPIVEPPKYKDPEACVIVVAWPDGVVKVGPYPGGYKGMLADG